MTRGRIVFILVIIALLYPAYRAHQALNREAGLPVKIMKVSTRAPAAPKNAAKAVPSNSNMQALQDRLNEEKQRLADQQDGLAALKDRQARAQQQVLVSSNSQVSALDTQIQNLMETLRDQRTAEADFAETAMTTLREQSSAAEVQREQLDQRIHGLELSVQQTQDQVTYWTMNFNNVSEQQARLSELQPLLVTQRQQLSELRGERLGISANLLQQTRTINSTLAQQKATLLENQNAIREQISLLRDEIARLQNNREQAKIKLVPLDEEIREAQKDSEDQAKKVQAVEASIQNSEQNKR